MAKGLAIPFATNRKGGAKTASGGAHLRQVIMTGLTPNLSRNPFQRGDGVEIGIPGRVVFATNNAVGVSLARLSIRKLFRRLRASELARLVPGAEGLSFTRAQGTGDLSADVRYIDLEADDENTVQVNLKDTQRTGGGGLSA